MCPLSVLRLFLVLRASHSFVLVAGMSSPVAAKDCHDAILPLGRVAIGCLPVLLIVFVVTLSHALANLHFFPPFPCAVVEQLC